MATIQLLLTDDANRRALASLVEQRHTPITGTDLEDADLYLVDDASLPQYRSALRDKKREQAPVFCPVVLIRRPQVSVDLSAPDSDEETFLINEVVAAPVEKQELFRRIANLVVRREQTVELHEKSERLEQLTNTLRHEVRNPLQILDGYLTIAREQGDVESFEKCRTAVDRMQRLFDETLTMIQGDGFETDEKAIDLPTICAECWKVISESDARIEVTTRQRISADEDRLRQLLENLFRNAVEHGDSGVTVTVGDLDGGFYVEDDGPGIPVEEREAVFENGYSTRGAGTGLGLAVVDEIVAAHGWDVQVTETVGGGARFEITGVASLTEHAAGQNG
jgi:signal transduction histidine kinase